MASKKKRSSRGRRRSRSRSGNARREARYEVVELAPGQRNDGRPVYVGSSEIDARDAYDRLKPYGAMMLKNGRVVRERRGKRRPLPENYGYGLGYMQGRGAS